MSIYSGLLVRDNFNDSGSTASTGTIWTSPDIIPYGQNILTPAQAVSTYKGPDIGQTVVGNRNNNIYVRSRNISPRAMTGNVNLYYANVSLLLVPSSWIQLKTPQANNHFVSASGGTPSTTIPEGAVALVQAPFLMSYLPTEDHYCFVAVVNDNNVPFVVPTKFASNAAFSSWVSQNANVGWRNIAYYPGSKTVITSYQTFGNCNPIASSFIFSLVGTNLPPGTTWTAQCADQRLNPPFSQHGAFSTTGTASLVVQVPANVGEGNSLMNMAFTFSTPNDQPFPTNAKVTVTYYQIPTAFKESPELAREESHVIREHLVAAPHAEGLVAQQLIVLGAVEVYPNDAGGGKAE